MMCGKSVVLCVPLLLLRVSNPNRSACPFRSREFSNFRQKLVSFARRVAEEEKDDDDDEFKEEIRTTR